jgi:hypothetical protein
MHVIDIDLNQFPPGLSIHAANLVKLLLAAAWPISGCDLMIVLTAAESQSLLLTVEFRSNRDANAVPLPCCRAKFFVLVELIASSLISI